MLLGCQAIPEGLLYSALLLSLEEVVVALLLPEEPVHHQAEAEEFKAVMLEEQLLPEPRRQECHLISKQHQPKMAVEEEEAVEDGQPRT